MKEPIKPSTLPPPPSPEERLRKALNELDALDCTYEVHFRKNLYMRQRASDAITVTAEKTPPPHAKNI